MEGAIAGVGGSGIDTRAVVTAEPKTDRSSHHETTPSTPSAVAKERVHHKAKVNALNRANGESVPTRP